MFRKKVYGQSQERSCPWCGKAGIIKNPQGIPVCNQHRASLLDSLQCACGFILEIRSSKWGPYGFCERCGNVSWSKIASMHLPLKHDVLKQDAKEKQSKPSLSPPKLDNQSILISKKPLERGRKEITIRSDEVDFLYGD